MELVQQNRCSLRKVKQGTWNSRRKFALLVVRFNGQGVMSVGNAERGFIGLNSNPNSSF
jgi:hypothetical protein